MAKYGNAIRFERTEDPISENVIDRALYMLGLHLKEILELHQFDPKEIKVYYEFESDKEKLSPEAAEKRFKELRIALLREAFKGELKWDCLRLGYW